MTTPSAAPPGPSMTSDLLLAFENLLNALGGYLTLAFFPSVSKEPVADLKLYADSILTDLRTIWRGMAFYFGEDAVAVEAGIRTVVTSIIEPFAVDAAGYWNALLTDIFAAYDANLKTNATTDPAQAVSSIVAALDTAATLGLGSRIVTVAFEAVLPKSLNVMNWLGPILANFSGFDKIIGLWRDAQLKAAIGNLAEYNANQTFLTAAPPGFVAQRWFAQGLITAAQRDRLVAWGGLMTEFQAPAQASEYRALQPRAIASIFQDIQFQPADMASILSFGAMRPSDVAIVQPALTLASTRNVREQYLAAAVRSTELGTMTPQELTGVLNDISYSTDAQNWVQLTVATRKLEQLAELYRKSISEGYKWGTVTDANYVASLEAIGIGAADAEAHYAVDSIQKQGKALAAAERAAAQLTAKQVRAATAAAVAEFRSGSLDAAELEAALVLAGLDPLVATYAVAAQVAKQSGPMVYVYGVELPRAAALVLREKVSAIGVQVKAQLITPTAALAELAALNIPATNAEALVADWAATRTPAADVGVLLNP